MSILGGNHVHWPQDYINIALFLPISSFKISYYSENSWNIHFMESPVNELQIQSEPYQNGQLFNWTAWVCGKKNLIQLRKIYLKVNIWLILSYELQIQVLKHTSWRSDCQIQCVFIISVTHHSIFDHKFD